jgi:hypothetical protein
LDKSKIKNISTPSINEKKPRVSKREKRLGRQDKDREEFNINKERFIENIKKVEQKNFPSISTNPKHLKNPESIMQELLKWEYKNPDIEGVWRWGIERKQLNDDFSEISTFLNSLTSNKWFEVLSFTTGGENRHYCNHYQEITTIDHDAIKRWKDIGLEEYDTAFRFRLSSKKRIWGYKQKGIFYLVWWDPTHEIYPVEKKHT